MYSLHHQPLHYHYNVTTSAIKRNFDASSSLSLQKTTLPEIAAITGKISTQLSRNHPVSTINSDQNTKMCNPFAAMGKFCT